MIYAGLYGHSLTAKEETISLERGTHFVETQQELHGYTADCTLCAAGGFASAWQARCVLCHRTSHPVHSSVCTASPRWVSEHLELGLLTTWILQLKWDCSEKPQFLMRRDFFLPCFYFLSRTSSLSEFEFNKVPAAAKLLCRNTLSWMPGFQAGLDAANESKTLHVNSTLISVHHWSMLAFLFSPPTLSHTHLADLTWKQERALFPIPSPCSTKTQVPAQKLKFKIHQSLDPIHCWSSRQSRHISISQIFL